MSRKDGYTAGKTKLMKKVTLPEEILKLIAHDAVEQDKTIAEIVYLICCDHYERDPGDPSQPRSSVKLRNAS